ncbi:hypothetical protein FHS43_004882 [Streptosporangium becharense]|uniref:Uncharacterized protein n=1 Tax=Streptosporangium becharense TaxID=1816182 RepID=A0A7W9IIE2_9ACTN|nr:hypothetical protein [Streptosporangium becharense]MBB2913578.1 hypothetical protein [Streptosporangium becharense]MBB5821268.1 hypothetical protein [Streptosporangium becharense]
MTRSEYDDIRAHIDAEADCPGDLLRVARSLLSDLEDARMREATLRAYYLRLLTAARATVAADTAGYPAPLTFLTEELAKRGQLPSTEDEVNRILADARTAAALLAALERNPRATTPAAGGGVRARRCAGTSRSLPR